MSKCNKCQLYKTSKAGKYTCVKLDGTGNKLSDIMLVGEAPGANEIIERKVFVGQAGQLLRKYLRVVGINSEDIFITNIVRCRPPINRTPTDSEMKACSEYLEEEIDKIKPKVIGLLGNTATKYFLGKSKITQLHGNKIWSEKYNCWLLPLYHPSYVMRFAKQAPIHKEFIQDLSKLKKEEKVEYKETKYKVADTLDKIKKLVAVLCEQKEVAFDTETTSLNPFESEILCASFCFKSGIAFVIPFQDKRIFNEKEQQQVKIELKRFCESDVKKIIQNAKFDIKHLAVQGIKTKKLYFDTSIAHYLLDETGVHNLDALTLVYTDMPSYKSKVKEYITGKIKIEYKKETKNNLYGEETAYRKSTILDTPLEELYEYAAKDADALYRVYLEEKKLIDKEKYAKLFYKVLIPVTYVLANMELTGILVDKEYIERINTKMVYKIKTLEHDLQQNKNVIQYCKKYEQKEFNFNSPKQLRELLFDEIGLIPIKYNKLTKTQKEQGIKQGTASTDQEVIKALLKENKVKVLEDLLIYRKANTFYSTYISGYKKITDESERKRIHTSYNLIRTVTGRLSSEKPNLQNIPKQDEEAKLIRKIFIAGEDKLFVEADYKQLEFRVFAHVTKSKKLQELLYETDIHTSIASKIFKIPQEKVTKEQRFKAKAAVFGGIMYGGGAYILMNKFGMSFNEAERIIEEFFEEFPKARIYIREQQQFVKENGYVISIFGRKRRLPDIYSNIEAKRNEAYRQAINAPIQGAAADIVYIAMIKTYINLKEIKSKIILDIHDALVVETEKKELEKTIQIIKKSMINPVKLTVPLEISIETGNNLGEMK